MDIKKFGSLTRNTKGQEQIREVAGRVADKLSQIGGNTKLAAAQKSTTVDSIFSNAIDKKNEDFANSIGQNLFEIDATGLSEEDKKLREAQSELITAFADVDGNGSVSRVEAENLAALDGEAGISQADIDKLYESLDIGSDATIDELLDAIDEILNPTAEGDKDVKGINLENSGVKQNDDGTFSVEVERYGSSVDGRNANSTLYNIIGNAYPDLSEEDRDAVLNQIADMNNIENVNLIYAGQDIKLPVIGHDENGKIQFSDTAKEAEAAQDGVGEEKVLYGDQSGYHIQVTNEDGSVTTFTRGYDGTESAKTTTSADGRESRTELSDGSVHTYNYDEDKKLSSLTVENADGSSKEYEFTDENYREGHPTKITTTNADGSYSIEERTYNEEGKIETTTTTNYDAEGNEVGTETFDAASEEAYNNLLNQLNSESDIKERASLLNTALTGEYGISAQQKADLINEVLGGMNVEGDAHLYVKGNDDSANALRTNINSVIAGLNDEEFMAFADQFKKSYGESLNEFMGQTSNNSEVNQNYVDRIVGLYSNAGSNLSAVMEAFPITESVQELLKGDVETEKIQAILEGTIANVEYEGNDLKVDNMAGKITSKSKLCDLLDDDSYSPAQKAYILSQIDPAELTAYIRDINKNSNEEKYLTQILGLIANVSVDA